MVPSPDGDDPRYVLYPIFESHDERTFEIARDVAEGAGMTLLVIDFVASQEAVVDESRHVGSSLLESHLDERHDVAAVSRYEETDSPVESLVEIAESHDTRLIVFDRHAPEPLVSPLAADVPTRISDRLSCDVVTVERADGHRLDSILVPIAGGTHTGLSVSVAGAIAAATDATVELFHVTEPDEPEDRAEACFQSAREHLPETVAVETRHLDGADVVESILTEAADYDLTVVGEPDQHRLKEALFGSVTEEITAAATNTVLVCRHGEAGRFEL